MCWITLLRQGSYLQEAHSNAVHNNICLIGMPGAGKSEVGRFLATTLDWQFIDTDRQIEAAAGQSLQDLLNASGYLALRQREETHVCTLAPQHTIIATGGSVVYSEPGMRHLKKIATVVYLETDLTTVEARVRNFNQRGIASAQGQTLATIFNERYPLYQRFADYIVPNSSGTPEQAAKRIIDTLGL